MAYDVKIREHKIVRLEKQEIKKNAIYNTNEVAETKFVNPNNPKIHQGEKIGRGVNRRQVVSGARSSYI